MGDVFEENCNLSLELEQHEFSLVLFNSTPFYRFGYPLATRFYRNS